MMLFQGDNFARRLLIGVLFGAVAVNSYGSESDGIYTFKTGQFEIIIMVEAQNAGNPAIIAGADAAVLARYIPAQGFFHSTNAILVKAPGQNILIDTGTGAGGIIIEKIKSLGVEPEAVNAVLLTHLHGDHIGSLQKDGKAVFPNAKIYLSARELEYFTKTNVNQGAVAALAPYESQIVTFEGAGIPSANQKLTEIVPGIAPIAAYGHTPGHTIFQIESQGQKFLVIGDLLHVALVQFPIPEINAVFDNDQAASAAMRRQVLSYAAANKIPVGGMHIVYPGTGTVDVDGDGFKFTPAP